jgi:hypothetical protein
MHLRKCELENLQETLPIVGLARELNAVSLYSHGNANGCLCIFRKEEPCKIVFFYSKEKLFGLAEIPLWEQKNSLTLFILFVFNLQFYSGGNSP